MQYLKSRFDKSCIPLSEPMIVESDTSDTLLEEPKPIPRDFSDWQSLSFDYKGKYSFQLALKYNDNDCIFVTIHTEKCRANVAMKADDFYSYKAEIYAIINTDMDMVTIMILKMIYNNRTLGQCHNIFPGGYYDMVKTDQVDKFKSFMDEYSEYRKSRQN